MMMRNHKEKLHIKQVEELKVQYFFVLGQDALLLHCLILPRSKNLYQTKFDDGKGGDLLLSGIPSKG